MSGALRSFLLSILLFNLVGCARLDVSANYEAPPRVSSFFAPQ
jgi:hypothetical protein